MDGWLKQSTAITLRIGPFLDSADGNTQETALTIAQADVVLSKAGGAFAAKNDATSCTHDSKGYYSCPLNATDTGTLGLLKLAVHVAGALAVWHTFMVVSAQVWDSLFGADKLDVAVVEQANIDFGALQKTSLNAATPASITGNVGGNVVGSVASVTADVGITQAGADKVWTSTTRTLTSLGSALVAEIWNALTSGMTTAGSIGKKLADWVVGTIDTYTGNTKQTGDNYARLGAPIGASISADIAAIEAQTDDIGVAGAGLTALGDTRLANLDATISSRLAPAGTVAACTLVNGLAANVITAASLNADAGTEIAAAVWAKTGAVTSIATELLLERLYEMVNNKMIVTEATGAVALRNLADGADVATGNVQDLGTTTVRAGLAWV